MSRFPFLVWCTLSLTTFASGGETPKSPDVLGAALDVLATNHLEPRSREALQEQALRALLKELDPYASYLDAQEWARYQDSFSGEYGGVGVRIRIDEDAKLPQVEYLMLGSAAGSAGVRRGDHILMAAGRSLEGLPFEAVITLLRGAPGSIVELTVRRAGATSDIPLQVERRRIAEPSIRGVKREPTGERLYLLDEKRGIGYIRVLRLSDTTVPELEQAIAALQRQKMKGLILDLRDSSGGKLRAAVAAADLFLDAGRILTVVSREESEVINATPGLLTDAPLVMLLNEWTVSSSEVLAGALADNQRAIAMGRRTFGKGRIQNYYSLGPGLGGMVFSTGTFQRPSGKTIDKHEPGAKADEAGIAPDPGMEIILEKAEDEALVEEMSRLDGPYVLTAEEQTPRVRDRVLLRAVEVLDAEIEKRAASDRSAGR